MIKRTLIFSNPSYLNTKHEQLIVSYTGEEKASLSFPIEDIGFVILENQQITITNGLLSKLAQSKTMVVVCDNQHLPCAMISPVVGHTQQSQRVKYQINCSVPLKKQLWRQTVISKIENQARHLQMTGKNATRLKYLAEKVTSGDSGNCEAVAAAYYFQNIFDIEGFNRHRNGIPPNNLLNYGYAILRAITARAISSTGLFATIGIKHHNKYNPYCLADDIMEPYRPFVDSLVFSIINSNTEFDTMNTELKSMLLKLPSLDVIINKKKSPLMIAMSTTTNSLYECFSNKRKKIIYPGFN